MLNGFVKIYYRKLIFKFMLCRFHFLKLILKLVMEKSIKFVNKNDAKIDQKSDIL
jgi:hypothetical protein